METLKTKNPFFRDGSNVPKTEIALIYNNGGIGDYIYWTTAIEYSIEINDYLHGYIVTPTFFADLAKLWLSKYESRFKILISDDLENDKRFNEMSLRFPNIYESVNACGMHLLPLGFAYYPNQDVIPKEWYRMPRIEGNETDISKFKLPEKYCVITVNTTSKTRTLSSKTINELSEYCTLNGVTPVFLGKKELLSGYQSVTPDDLDLSHAIDLREGTTLLEAACILANAKFVAGLDNGLLHLAACSDVPVIMAFTTVNPEHRKPIRREGTITKIITPTTELKCRFCQSNMRFLVGHDFRKCIYGDYLCCTLIDANAFIRALDKLI